MEGGKAARDKSMNDHSHDNMIFRRGTFSLSWLLVILLGVSALAQHSADPLFKATVESPAFTKNFPRVLFDEGHYNSETINGRYKPFADLLFGDGYHVVANRKPFTKESLQTFKVLVIVNPLGAEDSDEEGADGPAFTAAECDAIANWIRNGGSLLLVVDPSPFAASAEILAKRLELVMSKTVATDPATADKESRELGVIAYTRENQLLAVHGITNGRSESERVNRVFTFSGQSLTGPTGSDILLKLPETAIDTQLKGTTAVGRAQGIAFRLGKGRVVALGDAAMLSAQVTGSDHAPFGMNTPGADNKQLTLNIMHWLSGLLK